MTNGNNSLAQALANAGARQSQTGNSQQQSQQTQQQPQQPQFNTPQAALIAAFGGVHGNNSTGWVAETASKMRAFIKNNSDKAAIIKDVGANDPTIANPYPAIIIGMVQNAVLNYVVYFFTHNSPHQGERRRVTIGSTSLGIPALPTDDLQNILKSLDARIHQFPEFAQYANKKRVRYALVPTFDPSETWAVGLLTRAMGYMNNDVPQGGNLVAFGNMIADINKTSGGTQWRASLMTSHGMAPKVETVDGGVRTGTHTTTMSMVTSKSHGFGSNSQGTDRTSLPIGTVEWRIDYVRQNVTGQNNMNEVKRLPVLVISNIETQMKNASAVAQLFMSLIAFNNDLRTVVKCAMMAQSTMFSGLMDVAAFDSDEPQQQRILGEKGPLGYPAVTSHRSDIAQLRTRPDIIQIAVEATIGADSCNTRGLVELASNDVEWYKSFAELLGYTIPQNINVPKVGNSVTHSFSAIVESNTGVLPSQFLLNAASISAWASVNPGNQVAAMYYAATEGNCRSNRDFSLAIQSEVLASVAGSATVRYIGESAIVFINSQAIDSMARMTQEAVNKASIQVEQSSLGGGSQWDSGSVFGNGNNAGINGINTMNFAGNSSGFSFM